jgi:hypothetical protein
VAVFCQRMTNYRSVPVRLRGFATEETLIGAESRRPLSGRFRLGPSSRWHYTVGSSESSSLRRIRAAQTSKKKRGLANKQSSEIPALSAL